MTKKKTFLAESVSATKHKVSKAEKAKKAKKKADTILGKEKDTRKISKRGRIGEGRPPKYSNPEQLQKAIDDYFESCWVDKITETTDKDGNCTMSTVHYQNRPYTVMGLALALDMDRKTLCEYAKTGEFCNVVKKAKETVEMYVEEMLFEGKQAAGPIFWLKNHAGYRDRQELEHTGKDGGPIEYGKLDLANRIASVLSAAKQVKERSIG